MTSGQVYKDRTFSKKEKLCSEKAIERLFTKGESFIAYPVRVVYFLEEQTEVTEQYPSVLISVSKKKFKRAVKRNRVKRLIREVYRLNKFSFNDILIAKNKRMDIAFLYLKDELPTFQEIEKSILKVIMQLNQKIGDI